MKIRSAIHLPELTGLLIFHTIVLCFNARWPKELDNLHVGIRIWLGVPKFPFAKCLSTHAELVRQRLLADAP